MVNDIATTHSKQYKILAAAVAAAVLVGAGWLMWRQQAETAARAKAQVIVDQQTSQHTTEESKAPTATEGPSVKQSTDSSHSSSSNTNHSSTNIKIANNSSQSTSTGSGSGHSSNTSTSVTSSNVNGVKTTVTTTTINGVTTTKVTH